jgi:hypothetical protein
VIPNLHRFGQQFVVDAQIGCHIDTVSHTSRQGNFRKPVLCCCRGT